ncbi:MAG: hypothetical protein PWQ59_793 [Thermoanaerobacterium sp.]|jgi:SAM-dependent methyltransferase|nr:hypothetical protein [Thermoanaerobacterium sp.]
MDIKDFEEMWSKASSGDLTISRNFWDSRAEEFNNSTLREESQKRLADVIDYLVSKGMLHKEAEVLDIGCGPGRYSMEFARRAKRVTGLDISPKMIQYAMENGKKAGLDNVCFKLISWEELALEEQNWIKKFDLVFAAMCPGINSRETLMKMIQASKRFCFMSSFANRTDKIKDALCGEVLGQRVEYRWGTGIYCAFNILWHSGFFPEICYHDVKWENVWSLEKAIDLYSFQLDKGGKSDIEIKKKIESYLTDISENGMIKETTEAKIAWMYWEV